MPKLLTNREAELLRVALYWRERYENSNPEVGFGPSRDTLVQEIAGGLSFNIDEDDLTEAAETASGQ